MKRNEFKLFLLQETIRNWLNGGKETDNKMPLIPELPKEVVKEVVRADGLFFRNSQNLSEKKEII